MNIITKTVGEYLLTEILEDLTFHQNPSELKKFIEPKISDGHYKIALLFSRNSFPTSRLIAVLVSLCDTLKKNGGDLAIVAPNSKIIETFSIINLAYNDFFTIVNSVEELLTVN